MTSSPLKHVQINEGKLVEAEGLLDRILEKSAKQPNLGAFVARGTARALARDLQGVLLHPSCTWETGMMLVNLPQSLPKTAIGTCPQAGSLH